MAKPVKIYLDVCCLNRPFDDQTQDRIKLEAEAISILLRFTFIGQVKLIGSDITRLEISKITDIQRYMKVSSLLNYFSEFVKINEEIYKRAITLTKIGFKAFDAFHIACAEKEKVEVFLTTDDGLIKTAKKIKKN